jgi:hypothetical protein
MKQILRAAVFLAEIIASVWAVDLAFSLISDPSTGLLIAGIWLLFLVGAFWYYRIQVMKHRKEKARTEGGDPSEANMDTSFGRLEQSIGGAFKRRMRDAHWPGKRGDQG